MNECKKIYRFQTRYFKPNEHIKSQQGCFVYRLNADNVYRINIVTLNNAQNIKDVSKRYDFYDKYINDQDSVVMLIEYFQVNSDNGIQVDDACYIAKMQLQKYKSGEIEKINKGNTKIFNQ